MSSSAARQSYAGARAMEAGRRPARATGAFRARTMITASIRSTDGQKQGTRARGGDGDGAHGVGEAMGVGCGDIPRARAGGSRRIARDGWIDY